MKPIGRRELELIKQDEEQEKRARELAGAFFSGALSIVVFAAFVWIFATVLAEWLC